MSVLRIMNFNCDLRNSEPIFKKKRKISIEKKKKREKRGSFDGSRQGSAAQRAGCTCSACLGSGEATADPAS